VTLVHADRAPIRPGDTCQHCDDLAVEVVDGAKLCAEHGSLTRSACSRCGDGTPAAQSVEGIMVCDRHAAAERYATAQVAWQRDNVHMGPDGFRYSDHGNAERLAARHGDEIRYVPAWGRWIVFHGGRWHLDHGETFVSALAAELGRQLLEHVGDVYHDADAMKALRRWVVKCESVVGVAATLRAARSLPGLAIDHELLDGEGWLLNAANGTIDLRTGELRPHRPSDLLRMRASVPFEAAATAPAWSAFLATILPDDEVRSFVQRLLGVVLLGEHREEVLPICVGGGANGKSTLTRIVSKVLGDYAEVTTRDLFLALKHDTHPTAKADLFRIRFSHSGELPAGARLDEAQVKELTGGDRVKARRMREDFWAFDPTHTFWLHANHRPLIDGTDDAIWRRVLLIPFDVQIPPAERDPELARRIVDTEAPGVLNWMLDGLRAYRADGLRVPDAVRAATVAYRQESDTVAAFLVEAGLVFGPGKAISTNDLMKAHGEWFAAAGTDGPEKAHYQRLVAVLKERGVTQGRSKAGRRWVGVDLPAIEGDNV